MWYSSFIYYICIMLVTKTIRIDDKLHSVASVFVKTLGVSGGFSAYVQTLIINDLKKNGIKLPKEEK